MMFNQFNDAVYAGVRVPVHAEISHVWFELVTSEISNIVDLKVSRAVCWGIAEEINKIRKHG